MSSFRLAVATVVVGLALVLQVSLFPHFAWQGVVPNLCLLVVVGAALTRGAQFAAVLGFVAGVLLDLAPPADHVAGRWALALVVVGYVAGRVRQDVKPTAVAVVSTVAACSFIGTSIFAITGLVLQDPVTGFGELIPVILVAVALGRPADAVRAAARDGHVQPPRTGAGVRLMAPSKASAGGGTRPQKGRLRLIVIQALVFSLFATLFARLYYLQVVSGDEYHAQAASQSVREIVVQPQRGLIVDAMGRPLVTNRPSWVISVDRTMLGKMSEDLQARLVARLAGSIHRPTADITKRLVTCGDDGSVPGKCWNGSPYQPVPVATDVAESFALRILEQPEDFPAVLAEQQTVRNYPRPFGINLAHVLGYLSPITEDEYDTAVDRRRPLRQRRVGGRPRRRREAVRRVAARHARLPPGRRRLDGPGPR